MDEPAPAPAATASSPGPDLPPPAWPGDATALGFRLRRELRGEVRFDPGSRHLYATDASQYRHVPIGVVTPRDTDDLLAAVEVCRELEAPVTMRGGGTSLAGQTANVAVILDCSRHLDRILDLDPEARTATVEPGVVLDDLQRAAAPHALRVGPDPSTANRCTLGGMLGNDSCGVHSVTAGRTSDNVEALEVVRADGTRLTAAATSDAELAASVREEGWRGALHRGLADLRDRHADAIRARTPAIPRAVSGFNLDRLLPEQGFHLGRALVGSEGTCAVTLSATVRLVPAPRHTAVVVLGYRTLDDAADRTPALVATAPIGLEAIDDEVARGAGRAAAGRRLRDVLPPGGGWALLEYAGETPAEARARAEEALRVAAADGGGPATRLLTDPADQRRVWELRRAGLGATTFPPGERARRPGWEDAAVPPHRLGEYLRELGALLERHGLRAARYGHLADGCVHTKIDFDHTSDAGIATYRAFVEEAAELTVAYGGSLSGEHGDGQARAELLERMYGVELVSAFRDFKRLWDPEGRLNPGKVVDPRPLDADLRLRRADAMHDPPTTFAFPEDRGSLATASQRCVGVGLCRRDDAAATMCPSYRATRDERHSTRGRAHLLFELLQPDTELAGWRDREVHDALDLCLSCKACKAECPVGVDIAAYKAEFLHHHYRGRLRPRSAYALGLVAWWARAGAAAPRLVNRVLGAPRLGPWLRRGAGIAAERPAPPLAGERLVARFRRRTARPTGPGVLLFPDTFTDHFEPGIGLAAADVIEAVGWRPVVPHRWACCGRPLYDTGMLGLARRHLRRVLDVTEPALRAGAPVVVLEPSCATVFRDELPALLPDDPRAARLAAATHTLAGFLTGVAGHAPALPADPVRVHPHCHQAAVIGVEAERTLLADADGEVLDLGCCGMAGSFGFEAGRKHEVSLAVGEDRFAPTVRAAEPGEQLVMDGFSCRTQARDLVPDARVRHLAEVLRDGLDGTGSG